MRFATLCTLVIDLLKAAERGVLPWVATQGRTAGVGYPSGRYGRSVARSRQPLHWTRRTTRKGLKMAKRSIITAGIVAKLSMAGQLSPMTTGWKRAAARLREAGVARIGIEAHRQRYMVSRGAYRRCHAASADPSFRPTCRAKNDRIDALIAASTSSGCNLPPDARFHGGSSYEHQWEEDNQARIYP